MGDTRDFGIAVADADRLNDCYHELSEAFAQRPAVLGDENLLSRHVQATPGNEDWVHRCNSEDVAQRYIRAGLMDRRLPVWIRTASSDDLVDHYQFVTVTNRMISTGLYLTDNLPKGQMEDRPLWIKRADWRVFFDGVITTRYGQLDPTPAPRILSLAHPCEDQIIAMIRVVHAEGSRGRKIPKAVRAKPGFGGVKSETIKCLSVGMFPRVGRAGVKVKE
ncbi:hypothetical protein [Sphingomonas hengshuiensis]|uniref:hypothetical protein n=1 Tax=Sphingomonas hengshuiensis TaxID=1609977 RepID=UPI000A838A37|nr:hypothetical protein [Sphingomonas hengshuiensis]